MADDFEEYEEAIQKQTNLVRINTIVEGEIMDRALVDVPPDDDFFDEDVVKDGVYIPPLDNTSPKMRVIWPDAEHTENSVCLEGEIIRHEPLLIEHEDLEDE